MAIIKHLCLLVAMRDEAATIIETLQLAEKGQLKAPYPMKWCQGKTNESGNELLLSLVLAGVDERYDVDYVGTEPATLMAQVALDVLQPDLVISAGTAGGFARHNNQIGDIVISSDRFVFHDHHVPIAGLHESALGDYPCVDSSRLCRDLEYQSGIVSSGSSLAKKPTDIETMGLFDAKAKEMEVAAIAWVAMLHKVPCMAVKAITNLVDEDNESEQEFLRNFNLASRKLTEAVQRVIHYLPGKTIADLAL